MNYTYDSLYRLIQAITTGSTGYPQWGLSESYDHYGNRNAQATIQGQGCSGINCPTFSATASTSTNQLQSPYTYDLGGNMTNDGNDTLVYDAENRVLSATNGGGSGSYTYDGNNLRVEKVSGSTTTIYIFSGSKVIAEYSGTSSPYPLAREYIYSGSALLAKVESGATKYYHQDHLSNRVVSDSSGNKIAELGHYPFGESWYNATNEKWLFTTYERDSESSNDYAIMRSYVNRLGRFSSPDPLSGSPSNPQSLNKYAYSRNDPANLIDPKGMHPIYFCASGDPVQFPGCYLPGAGGGGGGGGGGLIMGNDIFDAIVGNPGTYLYLDMYGNMSFGFSVGLWIKTHNFIDSLSSDPELGTPGSLPGFQVIVQNLGTETITSGLIPELLAVAESLKTIVALLPNTIRQEVTKDPDMILPTLLNMQSLFEDMAASGPFQAQMQTWMQYWTYFARSVDNVFNNYIGGGHDTLDILHWSW